MRTTQRIPILSFPALLVLAASHVQGAISIKLPGNSESAGWHELGTNYPGNTWAADGFPAAFPLAGSPWPGAITPNVAGSDASAVFGKSSGAGYFASSSIYNAGAAGTHFLSDANPLANIQTLVVQFDLGSPLADTPIFTFNGGTAGPAPAFSATADGNHLTGFGGPPSPTTVHAWQWDLSSISDPITDWSIAFTTAPHGTIYEAYLDAGDLFAQVIPEPSSVLLATLASSALLRRRR
jgi:hypothetical protein